MKPEAKQWPPSRSSERTSGCRDEYKPYSVQFRQWRYVVLATRWSHWKHHEASTVTVIVLQYKWSWPRGSTTLVQAGGGFFLKVADKHRTPQCPYLGIFCSLHPDDYCGYYCAYRNTILEYNLKGKQRNVFNWYSFQGCYPNNQCCYTLWPDLQHLRYQTAYKEEHGSINQT